MTDSNFIPPRARGGTLARLPCGEVFRQAEAPVPTGNRGLFIFNHYLTVAGCLEAGEGRVSRCAPCLLWARLTALTVSHTMTGVTAKASTVPHWTASMVTVRNTAWRGGRQSTESYMTTPARNARFMALLENTPMWSREALSLRTSKA